MSEEINGLLEELKDSIENPVITFPSCDGSDEEKIENDALLTPKDCKLLLDYIDQLQQENQQLRECYCNRTD